MTKRGKIRLGSFTLAIIFVLSGLLYQRQMEINRYKQQLESGYRNNFGALLESVDQINTSLQKGRYASSRVMMSSLSNEVTRQAAIAKAALSGLPFAHIELENTSKFLSQVGDYAYTLSKKDVLGQSLSDEEKKNMQALSDTAYRLSDNLSELFNLVFQDGVSISEVLRNSGEEVGGITKALNEIETQFPETAGLLYDGPFSDHIVKMKPMLLEGERQYSEQEARKHVAESFGYDLNSIQFDGESTEDGVIPLYSYHVETGNGTASIDVTKVGGFIIDMMHSRVVQEAKLSMKDCISKAKEFMKKLEIEGMVENYYVASNNVVTVNFAYTAEGITYYPDLIKVSVAQDDGEILGFESRGFIMSHTERKLPAVQFTEQKAIAEVADGLTVESARLTVIPTPGRYEKLCHELKCVDRFNQRCLIYVNVEDGIQEQILILIENDNGVLSI